MCPSGGRVVSPLVTQQPGQPTQPQMPQAADGPRLLAPLVLPADLTPASVAPDAPPPGSSLGQHYRRCYGCGDAQPGGLHMRFTVGTGVEVVSEFVVTEDHEGAPGLAHGGLLSAALDETQATLLWLLRMPAVTVRLETDFMTPVPVGSTVRIKASCLGVADRKIYTAAVGHLLDTGAGVGGDSEEYEEYDVPAIRSAALFVTVPVEHFTAFGRPDLVEASMNRPADAARHRVDVNP